MGLLPRVGYNQELGHSRRYMHEEYRDVSCDGWISFTVLYIVTVNRMESRTKQGRRLRQAVKNGLPLCILYPNVLRDRSTLQ